MKLRSFQELVTRIVYLSTRDGKAIPITWTGTSAFTDERLVNLPALPAGTILTPHQYSVWLGYTIHEGPGHQTHTDLRLYKQACQIRNNPQFSYVLNLLEDIRIENADITRYPGDRRYLDSVHQFVDDKIPLEKCKDPNLLGLFYKHLFTFYRGLDTKRIQGTLPDGPITKLLARKFPTCNRTQDCIYLADELLPLLKQEQEEQREEQESQSEQQSSKDQDQDQDQKSQTKSESKDSNDENEGQASSQGSDAEPSPNSGQANSGNNSKQESSNTNNGDSAQDLDQNAREWNEITEIKNLIQKIAREIIDSNNEAGTPAQSPPHTGNAIFPPVDISKDKVFVPSNEDLPQFLKTRTELAPQILSLKKMFRIYLQSRSKKAWLRGLDEGSLDRDRLFIAGTGSSSIFKDRTTKTLTETAISLMIDLSGSMDEDLVRRAAIAIAEALSAIPQIKLQIAGFDARGSRGLGTRNPNSGRSTPMHILLFKDFAEPYLGARGKLGAMHTGSFTPLGDAFGKALESLIPRPEPRRIIFLLTDGTPDFAKGANHSDYLLMDQIHQRAKRLGIETFGLGIGDFVYEFLPNYVDQAAFIRDPRELPQELMKALRAIVH